MKLKLLFFLLITSYYSVSQSNKDTIIFSHNSGIYEDSVLLVISNLNSDKIFYSDNGDYPKKVYKKPILLKKSTSIRVKNSKTNTGYTRNYIFPGRKLKFPVICITMKPSDLYDSSSGIYVKGANASDIPPYLGANFHKNWEKVAYIEYIDTSNNVGFNQKTGIKIFGQFSAMLPQKSFSIHARKKYGKAKIKYPLFPNLSHKKYKSFILRNSGSDNCNTHIRDVMMTSLVKNFNLEVQDYQTCVVYLNGEYWGIYHMREKLDEHYLKQHFKVDKDSVAIMKHRSDVQHYGRLNYKNIIKFIKKSNFTQDSMIEELDKLIDIDNYLDYNIGQVYFSNIDAGGNIRYWRERKKGAKWRWILFDTDFGFGLRRGNGVDENTLKRFTEHSSEKWPFPAWSTLIIRKLLENDSIKNRYIQKFTFYLNTTFKEEFVINHINTISNSIKLEIPFHYERWRRKPETWNKNIDKLIDFASRRPNYLFTFLKQKFLFDTTYQVSINYNHNQGTVLFDSYKIDSGYIGRYFHSISYKILAKPEFGYEFSHWSQGNTKDTAEVVLIKDTMIYAYFIRKDISEHYGKIYFNEIGYKDSLVSSYLELYNSSEDDIDISGWIIKNGSKKIKIASNTILKPKSYFTFFRKMNNNNKSIENMQFGLFKIKKEKEIELYTKNEELVNKFSPYKKKYDDYNKIEFVNTVISNEWIETNNGSINKINTEQEKSERKNLIIIISFISLVSLIIITALFFNIRNRRQHSLIE